MRRSDWYLAGTAYYQMQHNPDRLPNNTPHEPQDWEEGMRHFMDERSCIFCGMIDSLDNLILDIDGEFRHRECILKKKEIYEQLKNKEQYESKDH